MDETILSIIAILQIDLWKTPENIYQMVKEPFLQQVRAGFGQISSSLFMWTKTVRTVI